MRGTEKPQENLFSYVNLEERIPADHPLRGIQRMVDEALVSLSDELDALYAGQGRPSIPPEYLLRAALVQILYSVRSEALLMEQLRYNLLFRWFAGLAIDDEVWTRSSFSKNRVRLLKPSSRTDCSRRFSPRPARSGCCLQEHFSVDGTRVEAWASMKSFQAIGGDDDDDAGDSGGGGRNGRRDFRGECRRSDTHRSTTDPDARLFQKAPVQTARRTYIGHLAIESRNGLLVEIELTRGGATAERHAARAMLARLTDGGRRIAVAADKGYDTREFVAALRERHNATPHVAQNNSYRRSAIDGRTTGHPGYMISQWLRHRVEEPFGWSKAAGLLRRPTLRGHEALSGWLTLHAVAYNLTRLAT